MRATSACMARKYSKQHLVEFLLVVSGIGLLSVYVFVVLQSSVVQARLKRQFEQEIAGQQARAHSKQRRAPPSVPAATIDGLARLDIPKAEISAMVIEGTDEATLRVGVGHIPGTALPGQVGNVALAAHRDSFFRGLRKLSSGDEIILTSGRGALHYKVESIRIVAPDDVSVLRSTPYPVLTLVTCYPFYWIGPAPRRWIVRARLMPDGV